MHNSVHHHTIFGIVFLAPLAASQQAIVMALSL